MSQFIDSMKNVKANYKRYDNWEQEQADDVAKREYLSQKLDLPKDKVELTRAKAEAVFRASNLMDKRSEDNCTNVEQTTGLVSVGVMLPVLGAFMAYPFYLAKQGKELTPKASLRLQVAQILVVLPLAIGTILWGNAKQKEASRIGRFQARKHELKDTKNFVIYTPQQIEVAKILAKSLPDKKDSKSLTKLFKDMKQISQDKTEYKKWLEQRVKNQEDVQKILNTDFTPQQLAQGEEDKEIIVNTVKDVNMKAEEYSENVENVFDTMGTLSFLAELPILFAVYKGLDKFKNVSPMAKALAPVVVALATPFAILAWATQEKKKASRVGRFVKKQEILNNPELIMAYTPEQLKQAENIKAPKLKKGFFKEIGDNFKFFAKYLKDTKAYDKYRKTEEKENEKIYDALKQSEVSETQLKDAKHLQEKTFRAFDKVDEMSQRYSEDTEAATEIAKEGFSMAWSLGSIGATALIGVLAYKGKLPMHRLAKLISSTTLAKNASARALINKGYEIIKNNKILKEDFCKSMFSNEARERMLQHPEIKQIFDEFGELFANPLNVKQQFKNGPISKWFRNLVDDISKLYVNTKLKNVIEKETKDPFEMVQLFYKGYKTLCNSVMLSFAPFMAILWAGPYAFNSWLTNIQIKAGRIGIMKAMDEIDNAKLFVNSDANSVGNLKKQII